MTVKHEIDRIDLVSAQFREWTAAVFPVHAPVQRPFHGGVGDRNAPVGIAVVLGLKLGNFSKADYIVIGKAVASKGGFLAQLSMRSCFANLSAKLIRVKDNKMIAYLDAAGNSAQADAATGGKEALVNSANNLAPKLIAAINKEENGKSAGPVAK